MVTSDFEYETLYRAGEYEKLVSDFTCNHANLDHEDVADTEKLAEVFDQLGERVFVKDYVKNVRGKNWICRRENCVSVAGARRVLE